jgi:hypothetical protein
MVENFRTMIPAGHQITWAEFKQAFKEHHIPKGLMDRKMKELLALKQGSNTVYEYAKKFNALCQYGGHHVDNDAKKIERFRDGLHGDLYERLNLYEPLLTDKRRIPLRSASVRTPHLFHHGIPKVLVNPRSKGITSA